MRIKIDESTLDFIVPEAIELIQKLGCNISYDSITRTAVIEKEKALSTQLEG